MRRKNPCSVRSIKLSGCLIRKVIKISRNHFGINKFSQMKANIFFKTSILKSSVKQVKRFSQKNATESVKHGGDDETL